MLSNAQAIKLILDGTTSSQTLKVAYCKDCLASMSLEDAIGFVVVDADLTYDKLADSLIVDSLTTEDYRCNRCDSDSIDWCQYTVSIQAVIDSQFSLIEAQLNKLTDPRDITLLTCIECGSHDLTWDGFAYQDLTTGQFSSPCALDTVRCNTCESDEGCEYEPPSTAHDAVELVKLRNAAACCIINALDEIRLQPIKTFEGLDATCNPYDRASRIISEHSSFIK